MLSSICQFLQNKKRRHTTRHTTQCRNVEALVKQFFLSLALNVFNECNDLLEHAVEICSVALFQFFQCFHICNFFAFFAF